MERLADAALDRAHTRFIVSDDPEECVERIRPYVDLGFTHLVFHAPGADQARFLDQFAADVLPLVRERFATKPNGVWIGADRASNGEMSERTARAEAPRRRPRPGATKKKRDDEVLDAAARVFARRGYADASVQDVADELGILKGSLYHYIKMKEDLLFWLLEAVHADVEVILEEVSQAEGLSPLERIELYVRARCSTTWTTSSASRSTTTTSTR